MPARVIFSVETGPAAGKTFVADGPDRMLFGRHRDCQISLPEDGFVSRHHFLLEVDPPHAYLRDLGSRNGTCVNGVTIFGRKPSGDPAEESRGPRPLALKAGDQIVVGNTRISVTVETTAACVRCGCELTKVDDKDSHSQCHACAALEQTQDWRQAPRQPDSDTHLRGMQSLLASLRDRYQIGSQLGRGGMGVVYKATQLAEPRLDVAIKFLLKACDEEDKAIKRFLREIKIALSLQHPGIVGMLDHGTSRGHLYFVMEFCNAGSIEDFLKRGRHLATTKWLRLMVKCLEGVAFAHDKNLVHRDLKPANILLHRAANGKFHPKIADFGLAKSLERSGYSEMTTTGSFGGTWHYMAKEQITDFKRVSPASDVWSLGAILYRLLSGRDVRTFAPGRDPIEVVLEDEPVPIREILPTLSLDLATAVDRALSATPTERFANAGEMKAALARILAEM